MLTFQHTHIGRGMMMFYWTKFIALLMFNILLNSVRKNATQPFLHEFFLDPITQPTPSNFFIFPFLFSSGPNPAINNERSLILYIVYLQHSMHNKKNRDIGNWKTIAIVSRTFSTNHHIAMVICWKGPKNETSSFIRLYFFLFVVHIVLNVDSDNIWILGFIISFRKKVIFFSPQNFIS